MTAIQINISVTDIATFSQYFEDQDVRIKGTFEKPLFHLADVARKIEDDNHTRVTKDYDETLIVKEGVTSPKYLTELGLYEYLLTSSRPQAVEFRRMVSRVLIQVKEQLINKVSLYEKIANTINSYDKDNSTLIESVEYGIAKHILKYPECAKYLSNISREDMEELKTWAKIDDQCVSSAIFRLVIKVAPSWKPAKVSYKIPDWM
jgi:prophage antirepressor-like protein